PAHAKPFWGEAAELASRIFSLASRKVGWGWGRQVRLACSRTRLGRQAEMGQRSRTPFPTDPAGHMAHVAEVWVPSSLAGWPKGGIQSKPQSCCTKIDVTDCVCTLFFSLVRWREGSVLWVRVWVR